MDGWCGLPGHVKQGNGLGKQQPGLVRDHPGQALFRGHGLKLGLRG